MNQEVETGKCLCETVKITLQFTEKDFDVCHCGVCRRWGGGPALTVEGQQWQIEGLENVSIYKSSEWAERGFCKTCGTHLFFRLSETDFYNFSFGLFPVAKGFKFRRQIYVEDKPDCYAFKNATEMWTEEDVLRHFKQD